MCSYMNLKAYRLAIVVLVNIERLEKASKVIGKKSNILNLLCSVLHSFLPVFDGYIDDFKTIKIVNHMILFYHRII